MVQAVEGAAHVQEDTKGTKHVKIKELFAEWLQAAL